MLYNSFIALRQVVLVLWTLEVSWLPKNTGFHSPKEVENKESFLEAQIVHELTQNNTRKIIASKNNCSKVIVFYVAWLFYSEMECT